MTQKEVINYLKAYIDIVKWVKKEDKKEKASFLEKLEIMDSLYGILKATLSKVDISYHKILWFEISEFMVYIEDERDVDICLTLLYEFTLRLIASIGDKDV